MSIALVANLRRTARIAYSRHPVARLCRIWRSIAGDPPQTEVFLLPLAGLALTLFVLSLLARAMPSPRPVRSPACSDLGQGRQAAAWRRRSPRIGLMRQRPVLTRARPTRTMSGTPPRSSARSIARATLIAGMGPGAGRGRHRDGVADLGKSLATAPKPLIDGFDSKGWSEGGLGAGEGYPSAGGRARGEAPGPSTLHPAR
jgi:hypothetical protein